MAESAPAFGEWSITAFHDVVLSRGTDAPGGVVKRLHGRGLFDVSISSLERLVNRDVSFDAGLREVLLLRRVQDVVRTLRDELLPHQRIPL